MPLHLEGKAGPRAEFSLNEVWKSAFPAHTLSHCSSTADDCLNRRSLLTGVVVVKVEEEVEGHYLSNTCRKQHPGEDSLTVG